MKNLIIVGLLISQSVSLIHIGHIEANKKNREFSLFYQEKKEVPKLIEPVRYTAPAELLPDIESFDDTLNGAPQGELFPEVAEAKPIKKRR